jgi:hypothetical protein
MRGLERSFVCGAFLCVAACGGEAPQPSEEVASATEAIDIGTNDAAGAIRDAVVLLGNGCTGTLIAPNVVLTAVHCYFEDPGYADGLWNNLPSTLPIYFGPDRDAPTYTAYAYQVSAPPFAPTPWPEDIALLRLTANVPASVAIPRPVYIDRPSTLTSTSTIYQVGYGGGRDRRYMTGSGYTDWLMDSTLPTNAFIYTATYNGPGIGDRDTNIEGGDSGGPMLFGSSTGFVMGDLSHWAPYGIATWGPGTGASCPTECTAPSRPSIRNWLNAKAPQKVDYSGVSITASGCSGGNPRIRVRVKNGGARSGGTWVDVFHDLPFAPEIGETSAIYASTASLAPEGWQDLFFAIPVAAGSHWIDVLLDTTEWSDELSETNNHAEAFLSLPDC